MFVKADGLSDFDPFRMNPPGLPVEQIVEPVEPTVVAFLDERYL